MTDAGHCVRYTKNIYFKASHVKYFVYEFRAFSLDSKLKFKVTHFFLKSKFTETYQRLSLASYQRNQRELLLLRVASRCRASCPYMERLGLHLLHSRGAVFL